MKAGRVKGTWFVTARAEATERFGDAGMAKLVGWMGEHGAVLEDAMASAWYPEDALAALLDALRKLVGDDRERAMEVYEAASRRGIGKFFSLVLSLSSPRFLLARIPVMHAQLREHPTVRVHVGEIEGGSRVTYDHFERFSDENYVLMTQASIQALMRACQPKREPDVRVHKATRDLLAVDVFYE